MDGKQKPDFTISDLRQKPEFFDVVVDRIWRAWWKAKGRTFESVADGLHKALEGNPHHFALIAHYDATYIGSTLVIASDMEERPEYTPWVAAVWVDSEYRKQGVGAALIEQAAQNGFALGVPRIYLCASRERSPFYLRRGWTLIEEDIGKDPLSIMIRVAINK